MSFTIDVVTFVLCYLSEWGLMPVCGSFHRDYPTSAGNSVLCIYGYAFLLVCNLLSSIYLYIYCCLELLLYSNTYTHLPSSTVHVHCIPAAESHIKKFFSFSTFRPCLVYFPIGVVQRQLSLNCLRWHAPSTASLYRQFQLSSIC